MVMNDIINQPEGRKVEFKEELPASADLNKTIIAFANDAGGELFIGIQDNPREVIGVDENDLLVIEEKISNSVHDVCSPVILPDISFLSIDNKHIIRVKIAKGNNPPYHLKNKGIEQGTYIRVGSTNRLADDEIIEELKRKRNNISFDALPVYEKEADKLELHTLTEQFREKANEAINEAVLKKLRLLYSEQNTFFPTNALILLSDDELKQRVFPYAKIECARFKGTVPGNFIDQKTIDASIILQAEQAYHFILRHISQGSSYQGVYRKDRWEYPVTALREVVRNAIIHRDYALKGKDIKIAIFDDKIEITSPGKLLPTVDFNDMEAGQSDIRNFTLAPVFKKLGIIEQWGNGLQLIADELKLYPEIEFTWNEPGISFRACFTKTKTEYDADKMRTNVGDDEQLTNGYERLRTIMNDYERLAFEKQKILLYLLDQQTITRKIASELIGLKETKTYYILNEMLDENLIKRHGKGRSTYYTLLESKKR